MSWWLSGADLARESRPFSDYVDINIYVYVG